LRRGDKKAAIPPKKSVAEGKENKGAQVKERGKKHSLSEIKRLKAGGAVFSRKPSSSLSEEKKKTDRGARASVAAGVGTAGVNPGAAKDGEFA